MVSTFSQITLRNDILLTPQPTDNAYLLLPIVRPDLSWELHLPGHAANAARLQVITHGITPFIKASVMFGRPACISKTTIVESAPATTAGEALTKLLNATMELVAMHTRFLEDSCTHLNIATVSVDGGSLYKCSPKTSPLASDDEMWWGNSKKKSPSVQMSDPCQEVNIRQMMQEFLNRDAKSDCERGSDRSVSSDMRNVSFTITETFRGSGK